MKTAGLLFVLFGVLAAGVSATDVSQGIDVHESDDGRVSLTIHLASGDRYLKDITTDWYRSILLSNDGQYLAIVSAEGDIIGSLDFVDVKSGKELWSESISDFDVKWVGDSMEYTAPIWWGSSFAVLETHVFWNGSVTSIRQYAGTYHDLGDRPPPPLSKSYSGIGPGSIGEVFQRYYNQNINFQDLDYGSNSASPMPLEIRQRLFRLKLLKVPLESLHDKDLSADVIADLLDYGRYGITTILDKYPAMDFRCPDFFNEAYRALDYCYSQGLLPAKDMNKYVRDLLSLLKIKESTVYWLMK